MRRPLLVALLAPVCAHATEPVGAFDFVSVAVTVNASASDPISVSAIPDGALEFDTGAVTNISASSEEMDFDWSTPDVCFESGTATPADGTYTYSAGDLTMSIESSTLEGFVDPDGTVFAVMQDPDTTSSSLRELAVGVLSSTTAPVLDGSYGVVAFKSHWAITDEVAPTPDTGELRAEFVRLELEFDDAAGEVTVETADNFASHLATSSSGDEEECSLSTCAGTGTDPTNCAEDATAYSVGATGALTITPDDFWHAGLDGNAIEGRVAPDGELFAGVMVTGGGSTQCTDDPGKRTLVVGIHVPESTVTSPCAELAGTWNLVGIRERQARALVTPPSTWDTQVNAVSLIGSMNLSSSCEVTTGSAMDRSARTLSLTNSTLSSVATGSESLVGDYTAASSAGGAFTLTPDSGFGSYEGFYSSDYRFIVLIGLEAGESFSGADYGWGACGESPRRTMLLAIRES